MSTVTTAVSEHLATSAAVISVVYESAAGALSE